MDFNNKLLQISDLVTYIKDLVKTNEQSIVKQKTITNITDDMISEIFKSNNMTIKILDIKFMSSIHYDPIQSKFLESHNKMFLLGVLYCTPSQSLYAVTNQLSINQNKQFSEFSQENQILIVNKIMDKFLTELKMRNNKKYYCANVTKQILQQQIISFDYSDIFIYFIAAYLNINIFIISPVSNCNLNTKYNVKYYTLNNTFNVHKQSIILWYNNNIFHPISIQNKTLFYYEFELFKTFLNNDIKIFDLQLTKENLFEKMIFSDNFKILYDNDIELIYLDNTLKTESILSETLPIDSLNDIIKKSNIIISDVNKCISKICRQELVSDKNDMNLQTEQLLGDIMICVKYTKKELNNMKINELKNIMKENNLSIFNDVNKIKTKKNMIDELCEL